MSRRHSNIEWQQPFDLKDWSQVQIALLMDLRDELQRLNALLRCPNCLNIPQWLKQIEVNTRKPRKRKRK